MMEASTNKPIQITGTPGETAALHVGIKRSQSESSEKSDTLLPYAPKRRRQTLEIEGTLELSELYSIVSPEDLPSPKIDENPIKEDVKFMEQALHESKNSPDESTKVGAIIVDPKTKEVLGTGWNRMPAGCEDRFAWSKGDNDILKTKYPFVLHGVKAAILDALKKNNADSLKGATLYSTLIPDHNDSQMIREVGISRVVYRDDKYPKYAFTIASKKLLDGLDWRQIKMPIDEDTKQDSDTD